jgi:nucleotide-binding universal stress UspA family protein
MSGGSLLVGWDGGAPSRDALALALLLARECGFRMRVVHCHPGHAGYAVTAGLAEEIVADARKKLDDVPQEALDAGATTGLVSALSASEGLQAEAERTGVDMIVVGSTHRGALGRLVPGAVAENLLHGAPCAVTVAPAGYADRDAGSIRMIAVAFDGSDESRAAVDEAVRLAQAARTGLKIIAVAPRTPFGWGAAAYSYEELHNADREHRREELAELAESLPADVRPDARLRDGDPAAEIVAECETGVDLLIVGSRGYGAVRRAMLGSVSTSVARDASCPVMVVPRAARHAGPEDDPGGEGERGHAEPSVGAG